MASGYGTHLNQAFWNTTSEYVFRSCWPAANDLLTLFDEMPPTTRTDRFLDAGCGPGDFTLEAALTCRNHTCVGIDYAISALKAAFVRREQHSFLVQARVWGRIFGLWVKARLEQDSVLFAARAVSLTPVDQDTLISLRSLFVEYLRRYNLASPYSILIPHLTAMGLLDSGNLQLHRRLASAALEIDSSEEMARLLDRVPGHVGRPTFAVADLCAFPFPDATFGKILLCEIEPLIARVKTHWLSEIVRICDFGGVILYVGARVADPKGGASGEIARVKAGFEEQSSFSSIISGVRRLASWWDPLFNDHILNEKVFTPYVLAYK
jgi:hypothetical protein